MADLPRPAARTTTPYTPQCTRGWIFVLRTPVTVTVTLPGFACAVPFVLVWVGQATHNRDSFTDTPTGGSLNRAQAQLGKLAESLGQLEQLISDLTLPEYTGSGEDSMTARRLSSITSRRLYLPRIPAHH